MADKKALTKAHAAPHGVVADVHPLDATFQFLFSNESFATKEDAIRYYFDDGAESVRKLAKLVREVCKIRERKYELLEFPAGHGCVTRHLTRGLENARITSGDFSRRAVDFIERSLGVRGFVFSPRPEDFNIAMNFDVVFSLSFLSHVPGSRWGDWLQGLLDVVEIGGYLIFTTHGLQSLDMMGGPKLDEHGLWSNAADDEYAEQDPGGGQTIVHPQYALEKIFSGSKCELVLYREASWWDHQDLWVLRRV